MFKCSTTEWEMNEKPNGCQRKHAIRFTSVRSRSIDAPIDVEQTFHFIPIDCGCYFCCCCCILRALIYSVFRSLVLLFGSSLLSFWFAQLHILSWFNKNRAQWWYCIVAADVGNLLLFCTLIRYSHDRYVYVHILYVCINVSTNYTILFHCHWTRHFIVRKKKH